jgi:hypothetical protein
MIKGIQKNMLAFANLGVFQLFTYVHLSVAVEKRDPSGYGIPLIDHRLHPQPRIGCICHYYIRIQKLLQLQLLLLNDLAVWLLVNNE